MSPNTVPDFPRSNSSASALRFCGMSEDPCGICVSEFEKSEFGGGVEDEIFADTGEVGCDTGADGEGFQHKIPVRHGGKAVGDDAGEAQFGGECSAVDAERVTGEGAGAEGGLVDAFCGFAEAGEIVREEGGVGEEEVGPADGLGALEMGVAGHEDGDFGFGARGQDAEDGRRDGIQWRGASSRSHSRMPVATWSLRERPVWSLPATWVPMISPRRRSFAVWMSSSAPGTILKGVGFPFRLDLFQSLLDLLEFFGGKDPNLAVGTGICNAPTDVLSIDSAIHVYRLVVSYH